MPIKLLVFGKKIAMKNFAFREYLENYLIFFLVVFGSLRRFIKTFFGILKKKKSEIFPIKKFGYFFFWEKILVEKNLSSSDMLYWKLGAVRDGGCGRCPPFLELLPQRAPLTYSGLRRGIGGLGLQLAETSIFLCKSNLSVKRKLSVNGNPCILLR